MMLHIPPTRQPPPAEANGSCAQRGMLGSGTQQSRRVPLPGMFVDYETAERPVSRIGNFRLESATASWRDVYLQSWAA